MDSGRAFAIGYAVWSTSFILLLPAVVIADWPQSIVTLQETFTVAANGVHSRTACVRPDRKMAAISQTCPSKLAQQLPRPGQH